MSKRHINVIRTCEKCSEKVKLYIVCFKCDLIYHPNCWRKLDGAYLDEKGHAFCCWNTTSAQDVLNEDLKQPAVEEGLKEKIEYECNDEKWKSFFTANNKAEQEKSIKSHINQHISTKHSGKLKRYKCKDCEYNTYAKKNLMAHARSHTNKRQLKYAYKSCVEGMGLQKHDKLYKCTHKTCNCVPGQKEPCECSTCEYASKYKNSLNRHILVKHSTEPKKYKCKDCEYVTHRKPSLVKHSRTHTEDRPFKCTFKSCTCSPEQNELCECNTCEYACKFKDYLTQHILVKHSGEQKKYKCKNCEYATHTNRNLIIHSRTHTEDRPFKCIFKNCVCSPDQNKLCECNTCGFAAMSNSALNRHILVKHSTVPKKYKCKDCEYASHFKTDLMYHSRIHANVKPFKCTYKNCNYSGHTKRNLERHTCMHTNERPFKCTFKNCKCTPEQKDLCKCSSCGFAAINESALSRHILAKHLKSSIVTNNHICSPI